MCEKSGEFSGGGPGTLTPGVAKGRWDLGGTGPGLTQWVERLEARNLLGTRERFGGRLLRC